MELEETTAEEIEETDETTADDAIEELAEPEREKGKWIVKDIDQGYVECPFCGSLTTCEDEDAISDLHYCFNCGADMTGERKA